MRQILFILLFLVLLVTGFTWYNARPLQCNANIFVRFPEGNVTAYVSYTLQNGKGIIGLNGHISPPKGENVMFNRTLYVSYQRIGNHYVMITDSVIKGFADFSSDDFLRSFFPAFYLYAGAERQFEFTPYKGSWLVSRSGVPSMYCMAE